jgi:hypothetical protein
MDGVDARFTTCHRIEQLAGAIWGIVVYYDNVGIYGQSQDFGDETMYIIAFVKSRNDYDRRHARSSTNVVSFYPFSRRMQI